MTVISPIPVRMISGGTLPMMFLVDHLYTPEGKNPVNEENKKALNC